MKKSFFRNAVVIFVFLIVAASFLTAWVFLIFPWVNPEKGRIPEASEAEFAENSEDVSFDTENGILYVNNELIVYIKDSANEAAVQTFLKGSGAEIDDSMADIGIYRLRYDRRMDTQDLEKLLRRLKEDSVVEDVSINYVSAWSGDSEEAEARPAVFPQDDWNGAAWSVTTPRDENWGMEAVDAPGAWAWLDELSYVRLGLIDSTPDVSHKDLRNDATRIHSSLLFIDAKTGKTSENAYTVPADNHGTHVAGIMGAMWGNRTGVSGITGGKGELYHAAVFYRDNQGNITTRYATAYTYLLALKKLIDQDVRVINISQNTSRLIGFAASHGNENAINYLTGQANMAAGALSRIIRARASTGKDDFLICVAAGNSNNTYYYKDAAESYGYREEMTRWEEIKYLFGWRGEINGSLALYNNFLNLIDEPEVRDRIIVVGANEIAHDRSTDTRTRYAYADYSNVGSRVDIVAPGTDIYSTVTGGYEEEAVTVAGREVTLRMQVSARCQSMSGTSMSTPHVTGAAGLLFAANPALTGPQVKQILLATATGRYHYENGSSGLLNVSSALSRALESRRSSVPRVLRQDTSDALDLCFVIDTTASMGDDIDNAKSNMSEILLHLQEKTENYRVALVDYRDFPYRTGRDFDYAFRLQLLFTSSEEAILSAINGLTLGDGGDGPETVYSGIMTATKLSWREEAKKVIIIMGDAPPLDPEPTTNYTYADVLMALLQSDISLDYNSSDTRVVDSLDRSLINVYSIGTDASSDAQDFFEQISEDTGGSFAGVGDASEVTDAIINSIEQIEVAKTVSTSAAFGNALSGEEIDFYAGNAYLFTAKADTNGMIQLDGLPEDIYQWKSNGVYAGGTIAVESGEGQTTAHITRRFPYAPVAHFVFSHPKAMLAFFFSFLCLCCLMPLWIGRLAAWKAGLTLRLRRRNVRRAEAKFLTSGGRRCPHCGKWVPAGARFCGTCGQEMNAAETEEEKREN